MYHSPRKNGRKSEMINIKHKKRFAYTLVVALLFSVAAASSVQARTEDVSPPAVQPSEDTPNLIMTLDGNTTEPENQSDQPNLYQAQDAPATVDKNSTRVIAQDDAESDQENSLIMPQSSTDNTATMVGIAVLAAAVVLVGAFLLVRKKKSN
jgi:hypothetical protein